MDKDDKDIIKKSIKELMDIARDIDGITIAGNDSESLEKRLNSIIQDLIDIL